MKERSKGVKRATKAKQPLASPSPQHRERERRQIVSNSARELKGCGGLFLSGGGGNGGTKSLRLLP